MIGLLAGLAADAGEFTFDCSQEKVAATRAQFLSQFKSHDFDGAYETLRPIGIYCLTALSAQEQGEVLSDLAVSAHKTGNDAACVTWITSAPVLPDNSATFRALSFNAKTCGGSQYEPHLVCGKTAARFSLDPKSGRPVAPHVLNGCHLEDADIHVRWLEGTPGNGYGPCGAGEGLPLVLYVWVDGRQVSGELISRCGTEYESAVITREGVSWCNPSPDGGTACKLEAISNVPVDESMSPDGGHGPVLAGIIRTLYESTPGNCASFRRHEEVKWPGQTVLEDGRQEDPGEEASEPKPVKLDVDNDGKQETVFPVSQQIGTAPGGSPIESVTGWLVVHGRVPRHFSAASSGQSPNVVRVPDDWKGSLKHAEPLNPRNGFGGPPKISGFRWNGQTYVRLSSGYSTLVVHPLPDAGVEEFCEFSVANPW